APGGRKRPRTGRAGSETVAGAGHPAVQRLQFFLSESRWDPECVNARRLELLAADPATAPHEAGVLVIDDSGDRKDGSKTAHVGRQWLGRYGKTDNGVVTVTTVWADERVYYPVDAVPYTPARHFAKGKNDPAFRTKLAIGAGLAIRAREAGVAFRAVAAADPGSLPGTATWYLVTNLPRPGGPREPDSPHPAAGLAEIVRIYAVRNWIEQSYKQVKDELGWADFQVRSDIAIRRHQVLVNCAFSFCWAAWFAHPAPQDTTPPAPQAGSGERGAPDPPARHRAGPARSGRCAHGWPRGSRCSAGGPPGRKRPRPASCKP